jgi:chromosomal replication initiation ATPase DnaA
MSDVLTRLLRPRPLIGDTVKQTRPTHPNKVAPLVLRVLGEAYGITPEELTGRGRTAPVAMARQVGYYLLRSRYHLTFKQAGCVMGGRDHSSVYQGFKKVEEGRRCNLAIQEEIEWSLNRLAELEVGG